MEPRLSNLEQKIYGYIRRHVARHGQGPTLPEIGEALGLSSKGSLHRYVQGLIDKGFLDRPERSWRSLRVLQPTMKLPLLGRIAAGKPIEAIPNHDEINLPEMLLGKDRFALRVKGDSMRDAGILDGDTVIVKQTSTAKNGDIVVALIDHDEATLKYFKRLANTQIQLIPANTRFETMTYDDARIQIQGVVVGQLRTYD
ncbi:MAG: transcriptional repressor LexA [Gammaproteobacteria bacterium]|nr:transcriptional repressor LexA [Gammaproteobacteria bacterium]